MTKLSIDQIHYQFFIWRDNANLIRHTVYARLCLPQLIEVILCAIDDLNWNSTQYQLGAILVSGPYVYRQEKLFSDEVKYKLYSHLVKNRYIGYLANRYSIPTREMEDYINLFFNE